MNDIANKILCSAIKSGNIQQINEALNEGADINWLDSEKPYFRPIMYAALLKNNVEVCEFLLEKGVDINLSSKNNVTPCYLELDQGNLRLLKLFLVRGSNMVGNGITAMWSRYLPV